MFSVKRIFLVLSLPFILSFDDEGIEVARKYVSVDGRATLVLKRDGKAVETFHFIRLVKTRGKWSADGNVLMLDFKDTLFHGVPEFYDVVRDTLKQGGEAIFVKVKK